MNRTSRALAGAATAALLAGSLVTVPLPAVAADLESARVLSLAFDGSLADAAGGPDAAVLRGTAGFGAGIAGEAFSFDGATALSLGTSAALQPQDLSVSFWFNPSASMGTAEQVFAWAKTVYNSDGWYLTSENGTTPLALSIGPSSGQPYKVAVEGSRADFFPVGEWTHVAVAYDHASKSVAFYRNGVKQPTTVKVPVSATASGVLGAESTSVKTLGFNGPSYGGSYLKGRLDEFQLYSAVASTSDVVSLYSAHAEFDAAAAAQADADRVTVPATAAADFALPETGASGSDFVWTSSDEAVIAVHDGIAHITRPENEAVVRLSLEARYGGGPAVTRQFDVTVAPAGEEADVHLEDAGLAHVELHDDYLLNANGKTIDYLLSLDPERFLFPWYQQAGLTPTTPSGYGGWERSEGTRFQGHFFGHYISALAQAHTTTTDAGIRSQLLTKLTAAVDGLKRCQDAWAAAHPASAGFIAPFPLSVLPSGGDGLLVPFYNLHKVLAGLLDAHQYAPEGVSAKALAVASGFGTWVREYAASLPNPATILNTEYGGMNEALYELYEITGNPAHKRAAEYFDEVTLFQQLAAGQDVLNGKHANTTIPKLIGALKRYTLFTENEALRATLTQAEKDALPMYRAAAENFWQIVVRDHTYANGANSQSEHFHGADTLYQHATNGVTTGYGENSTAEGCNEYNMLKLSHALFAVTKDVKYADYYESTFINTILASQNPETGMVTYFQPQTAGYAKIFGTPLDQFWCDHGTGIESFTKLGDSVYFLDRGAVYVNQFRSSELTDAAHNLRLAQSADVPASPDVHLTVSALDGGAVAEGTVLKLRVPSWVASAPTLVVNGQPVDAASLTVGGYISLPVSAGDEIDYTLPATVAVADGTENPNWVAFTYGPVLLATELSRDNVNASYTAGVLVQMSVADKSLSSDVIVADPAAWKADAAKNIERIADGVNANGMTTMRFRLHEVDPATAALTFEPYYSLYGARYATYMTLVQPDSAEAQALILRAKQQQRIEETTIDSLTSFDDNNSEADKNYRFNKSSVGVFNGQGYRDAQRAADAWFQYDMEVDPSAPANFLGVRYYGGDVGRTFDVYLNDVLFKHERVTDAHGATSWYVQYDEIPRALLDSLTGENPTVTVRFQSNGTSFVGGVYGVYTSTSDRYATDAALTGLSVEGGALSPAFARDTTAYTVTVPADATEIALSASPATGSGLVRVDGILIDDTVPRTVPIAAGDAPTTVAVTSSAQDHVTTVDYTLTIVRESAEPTLSAAVATRCAAGRAVLVATVSNAGTDTVTATVRTPFGAREVAVPAGRSASTTFSTRQARIDAGEVEVIAGEQRVTARYDARVCG